MLLKAVPESLLEWVALRLNLVPLPLLHGQMFPVISKAVLVAADSGVFSAIAGGADTAVEVARKCNLAPLPTEQLLQILASTGYLRLKKGSYQVTPMMRKWLRSGSGHDLSDLLVYNNRVVWKWMEHLDNYLATGTGIDYHQSFGEEEWELYQKAMLAVSRSEVEEFARKCPVPVKKGMMLDIGGAHGLHVKAFKARYPGFRAEILDLPGALRVWEEQRQEGIVMVEGDILNVKLKSAHYDLILMSSLAHHFSLEENLLITRKVADALKPGGIYIINEFVRPDDSSAGGGLVGASSNLFFGLTSTSGTWTISETQEWQRGAGLTPLKPVSYIGVPGRFQLPARKGW